LPILNVLACTVEDGWMAGRDHWAMETDRWGVPHNMFGAIGEDIYGLVGRITLVSAVLEDRLHVLFCALASAPQEERAGQSPRSPRPVDNTWAVWRPKGALKQWLC
jgi:hypothetical protein